MPTAKAEQLSEGILSGAFRPGTRRVEAPLAEQLAVSQATVNQALCEPHSNGVVDKCLNRSTTVIRFGLVELNALFSVRLVLECLVAQAALGNLTPLAVEGLRRRVDEMRAASKKGNVANSHLADREFHQELCRLSENRFLIQACRAALLSIAKAKGPKPLKLRSEFRTNSGTRSPWFVPEHKSRSSSGEHSWNPRSIACV